MQQALFFSGKSHLELAKKVSEKLNIPLGKVLDEEYKNGCFEKILEGDIKNKKIFLFQTSRSDFNDLHNNIWELFQMINAAKSCGAKEVIIIMPYFSYGRSDKSYRPGMGVASELLAKLFVTSGADGFIGIDFHSDRLEKFFSCEVKNLSAISLLGDAIKKNNYNNAFILPADIGAFKKGSILAKELNLPVGQVEKERFSETEVKIKGIKGDFQNKDVIIFDDEISTGTTLKTLAEEIEDKVNSITFVVTHGLFVGNAVSNFKAIKKLKEIIITDTIPIKEEVKDSLPLNILSVADLLAEEIKGHLLS